MNTPIYRAVAIASGGLDSTTMLYDALANNVQLDAVVSFNYGQRHKKELEYAKKSCDYLGLEHIVIDLWTAGLTGALSESGSSLVSDTDVPDGHYAEETMKQTVVPNRNMIMLSIAAGIAVSKGSNKVMTGVHAGDHFIYPDCRPPFIAAAAEAIYVGNEGFGNIDEAAIVAPYLMRSKADIAHVAFTYDVDLSTTWSCYKGGDIHCGRCGTCVERLEAIAEAQQRFRAAGLEVPEDTTVYADTMYWQEVVANADR